MYIDLARAVCGGKPLTLFYYYKTLNHLESRNEWCHLLEPWNTSFDDFVEANRYQERCETKQDEIELQDYWAKYFVKYVDQLYAEMLIHQVDVGRINNTPTFDNAPGCPIPFVLNHENDKGLCGIFCMCLIGYLFIILLYIVYLTY